MTVLQRFVVLYFTLYIFPFPLDVPNWLAEMPIPLRWIGQATAWLSGLYGDGLTALGVWIGDHVLGPGAVITQPTGSGDTMSAYVQTFINLGLAVVGTMVWSFARRGQPVSPRTLAAFRVYLRYGIAAVLLSYGFAKVPPLQFQPPGPEGLIRTYGESSPMGLLWTFMGFSPAYTMFVGMAELVPGFLLMFRRVATLGAVLGAATMLNVVALNFMYDVPVKLFSAHIWLMLVIIAAPDIPRLLNVLVFNRDAPAAVLRAYQPSRLAMAGKGILIVMLVAGNIVRSYQGWYQWGPGMPLPPLAGIYDVESFEVNGETKPPLWTDQTRWRRLVVSRRGYVVLQRMGDQSERFGFKHEEKAGTLILTLPGSKESFTLTCVTDEGGMTLEGPFRGDQIKVALKKTERAFPINSRGFNWIQELPYNR
jgi:hypothetical protein